jgi:hypothetical protein
VVARSIAVKIEVKDRLSRTKSWPESGIEEMPRNLWFLAFLQF